jgi:CO/xanthine dehydrogenase FAD-binding subunit
VRSFEYHRPKDVEEAVQLRARLGSGAPFLAGGTDLIVRLKDGEIAPEALIDISFIETLKEIREVDDTIVIGSLASYADLGSSPLVREFGCVLAQAAVEVGAPQIQNAATIGGNIANASPAADGIPPLYALGARITLAGRESERTVAAEDFFTGPGTTVMKADELITFVSFPKMTGRDRGFFKKIGQRNALAISKASVAAVLRTAHGRIEEAKIALGAVAPTVIRCPKTEALLRGKEISGRLAAEAAKTLSSESRAIGDVRSTPEYRNYIVGVLFERGLRHLFPDILSLP